MARIRAWAEHRWARARLSQYVDGELTPGGQRRLQRHAADCADCGRTLRCLIRVVHVLHALPATDRPSIAPMIISRLRAEAFEISPITGGPPVNRRNGSRW